LANIRVIKKGINVSKILKQLQQYPQDWGAQKDIEGVHDLVNEYGFPAVQAGVLQLKMGAVKDLNQYVGDSQVVCRNTSVWQTYRDCRILKEKL
jgi:hypothetical protein